MRPARGAENTPAKGPRKGPGKGPAKITAKGPARGARGSAKGANRPRIPAQTRAELLAAASRLFVRDGLDTPSLDAICEEAGYTRGAFYVHFGSREELVAAVVESAFSELIERIVRPDEDLPAIIGSFVRALAEGSLPVSGGARISQVLEACMRSWDLRVKFLAVLVTAKQRIAEAVRRSQESGVVRASARPDAIAEMLLALVLGVQVAGQLGAPYDAAGVEAELRTMLGAGPKAKSPSPRLRGGKPSEGRPR